MRAEAGPPLGRGITINLNYGLASRLLLLFHRRRRLRAYNIRRRSRRNELAGQESMLNYPPPSFPLSLLPSPLTPVSFPFPPQFRRERPWNEVPPLFYSLRRLPYRAANR